MLPKPDVIQLLSHATVFVCPSIYEPLGIVNLEAMACETAVVATATGGIPEVVDDGVTGLLVPFEPGDDGTRDAARPGSASPPTSPSASTRLLARPGAGRGAWAAPGARGPSSASAGPDRRAGALRSTSASFLRRDTQPRRIGYPVMGGRVGASPTLRPLLEACRVDCCLRPREGRYADHDALRRRPSACRGCPAMNDWPALPGQLAREHRVGGLHGDVAEVLLVPEPELLDASGLHVRLHLAREPEPGDPHGAALLRLRRRHGPRPRSRPWSGR